MLAYLCEKWNLIDHHRINKFMQLVRYLLRQAMRVSQKKLDEVLLKTVFAHLTGSIDRLNLGSGIVDHVIELYFETACEVFLAKTEGPKEETLPFQKLELFEKLLRIPESLDTVRMHIA